MDNTSYFSVDYQANINISVLPVGQQAPDQQAFLQEIPKPFLISSEVTHIDVASLRSLRKIADASDELADYLANQSRKIDVILSYVLQLQDDEKLRFTTQSISASGLSYFAESPLEVGQIIQTKVFLPEETVAVYAYATIESVESLDDQYLIKANFCRLRDEDQEHLIRATLHIQTKQLQQRRSSSNNQ